MTLEPISDAELNQEAWNCRDENRVFIWNGREVKCSEADPDCITSDQFQNAVHKHPNARYVLCARESSSSSSSDKQISSGISGSASARADTDGSSRVNVQGGYSITATDEENKTQERLSI